MPSTGILPYDAATLLKGPTPFIYALASKVAVPSSIADILDPDDPTHPLLPNWNHGGATIGGGQYGRQFATQGYQIDQADGDVDQDVTDVIRTFNITMGALTPEIVQILEQAPNIDTLAKAKGRSAEKQVKVGTVETLETYRIVFLARRLQGKGADVTMSGGGVRGAFGYYCMYEAKITGDNSAIQLAKGQLAQAPLSFQAYPDSSQEPGEEHGFWGFEQSGTIEAAE